MKMENWPVTHEQENLIMESLRFDYFKWDLNACGRRLVLPSSIVLNSAEHDRAVQISERFAKILSNLEKKIAGDPSFLRSLAIPEDVIPLVQADQDESMQLARYDLFLTPSGQWMVSEFNEDVPGGFNEAGGIADLLSPFLTEAYFPTSIRAAITKAFSEYEHVAFVFATGYSEDLQHMLVLKRWLDSVGHKTQLASPTHLTAAGSRASVFDQPCDAIVRFYPAEWYRFLENRDTWLKLMPHLPSMNPLRRLIRQSKRLYAFWKEPGILTPEDREFVCQHTPETHALEYFPDSLPDRKEWVLKHAFGRMGDTVIMGSLCSEEEWRDAWRTAKNTPEEWIVQRCFEVSPCFAGEMLYPALGTYMVNEKFAGYYSRAAARPFINHEAYHVSTLVKNS
jgi:glutathionylspermidine synthase